MDSKVKVLGHAVHPLLIPFPIGLLLTSIVFDVIYLATGTPAMATVAYWMLVAGIVGGLLAAPFGWIDWHAIPANTRAKSVGLMHGLGNVVVLLLFIGSWWRRESAVEPDMLAYFLSLIGAGLIGFTAWLGGELVERLSVGVDDGANLNAPNSLSQKSLR